MILFIALIFACEPLFVAAQVEVAQEAPPVVFEGGDDNYVAAGMGERVSERGLQDGLEKNYLAYQEIMLDFLKKTIAETPTGGESQREAAFRIQNYLLISALIGVPTAPLAGGLIGGAVGGALGVGAYGAGTVPAAAAGTAIGSGSGMLASWGYFGIVAAVLVVNLNHINEQYPPNGVGTRGADDSDVGELIDEWIDESEDADTGSGISERGGRPRIRSASMVRARPARTAGPQESLFVHLIATCFGDRINDLARYWDKAPGLTAKQKQQLRQAPFLRSVVQSISYVRSHRRAGAKALPAMPLSGWQRTVTKLLSGDDRATQDLWLAALAAGETRLTIRDGTIRWQTPQALRQFGAQSAYSAQLSKPYVKVGGNGSALSPYLKVKVTPGPFDIALGKAHLEGGLVKVGYTIRKNSRVGTASVRYKIGGSEQTTSSFSPKLRKELTGTLMFKFVGPVLMLDRVEVGSGSFRLSTPSFSGVLAPLNGIVKKIKKPLTDKLNALLGRGLKLESVLNGAGTQATQNLMRILKENAGDYGLVAISALKSIRVVSGKLQLQVIAEELTGVPQLSDVATFMRKANAFVNRAAGEAKAVPAAARRRR